MFPLACKNNLQGYIFLKEISETASVFPSFVYFLQKKIYSQNDETDVLEVLEVL